MDAAKAEVFRIQQIVSYKGRHISTQLYKRTMTLYSSLTILCSIKNLFEAIVLLFSAISVASTPKQDREFGQLYLEIKGSSKGLLVSHRSLNTLYAHPLLPIP